MKKLLLLLFMFSCKTQQLPPLDCKVDPSLYHIHLVCVKQAVELSYKTGIMKKSFKEIECGCKEQVESIERSLPLN